MQGNADFVQIIWNNGQQWNDTINTDSGGNRYLLERSWVESSFTDPNNPDTDGDGVNDGDEIINGTNPNLIDNPPAITLQPLDISATYERNSAVGSKRN